MCTVSVVPTEAGFRVVCNRDEQRARPVAQPPTVHHFGRTAGVWPGDPLSGGTWIGVNDAGLAMVVLNRPSTQPRPGRQRGLSRGTIIPGLLRLTTAESAIDAVGDLPLDRFDPFTLVIVQGDVVCSVTSSEGALTSQVQMFTKPVMFTSSSLGEEIADGPRRGLFARLVERTGSPLYGQRAFHRHRWPHMPEISVLMSRRDAATVSRTLLDVGRRGIRVHYTPIPA